MKALVKYTYTPVIYTVSHLFSGSGQNNHAAWPSGEISKVSLLCLQVAKLTIECRGLSDLAEPTDPVVVHGRRSSVYMSSEQSRSHAL